MAEKNTTPAFIIKDFSDAGTEANFTKGAVVPIEVGAFANYKAAGLVRAPNADEKKTAAAPATA